MSEEDKNKTVTLDDVLREVHYLKSYKGYPCLVSCIRMVKEDEDRLCGVRKKLYGPVAGKYGMKVENLERNLRTVRDVFQNHGGIELLEKYLGVQMGIMLYPHEMIEALAECITDG